MKVEREDLLDEIQDLRKSGYDYLVKITAVDYGKNLKVIYFIRDIEKNMDETVELDMDYDDAWVPTILDQYRSADWYERELKEMFGIEITGRVAKRLLLEKWDGIDPPFRKSFEWNKDYRTEVKGK